MLFGNSRISDNDVDSFVEGLLLSYVIAADDLLEASTIENLADKYIPIWVQLCNYAEEHDLKGVQRDRIRNKFADVMQEVGYSNRVIDYLTDEFQARLRGDTTRTAAKLKLSDAEFYRLIDYLTMNYVLKQCGEYSEAHYDEIASKEFHPLWYSFKDMLAEHGADKKTIKGMAMAFYDSLIHLGFSDEKSAELVLDCKKHILEIKH